MKKRVLKIGLAATTVAGLALSSSHMAAFAQHRSDAKAATGWHFYDDPKLVAPKKKPEILPTPPQGAPARPAGPAPLSSAWIRDNLPAFMDAAIDDPSPRNVEIVAYLERVAMDRAERFSQAKGMVPINNPVLDEFARQPISTIARNTAEAAITVARKEVLDKLTARLGLWYFYSSTCPYCAKQEPILERFRARVRFDVLNISLDGGPLASGAQDRYVVNDGHAEQLGVMTTPTLVVADTSTGQLHNLTVGLRTVSEIEGRILDLAASEGWITRVEYDAATRGEHRRFITDGLSPTDAADLEKNPDALLKMLREASRNGGGSSPWLIEPGQQTQGTSR